MNYLSVCSGIEAASVAWQPLGWHVVAVSEIDAFPSAVLAHHYPSVPNWGDMTRFHDWPGATVDLLVGGTPCQSFSVAGLRKGLADPRGSLLLTYLAIADRYRPRWLVWENVPGVLSADEGRAFGSLLGGLAELGYGFAYRVLDAQHFHLAQRRARVFVVGCLGDWRRAAAVLFEHASLSGHPAPRREARQTAPTIPSRRSAGGGLGTDFDCDGGLIPMTLAIRGRGDSHDLEYRQDGVANAILTPNGGRAGIGVGAIAFDTTQITSKANYSNPKPGGPCHPLAKDAHPPAIAFDARQSDVVQYGDKSGSLDTDGHTIAVAFAHQTAGDHTTSMPIGVDFSPTLKAGPSMAVQREMHVRRLTPRECERLQGFPDDYTLIHYKRKPVKDGPRYKALGNSMAVPVMAWIGRRIQQVEAISDSRRG